MEWNHPPYTISTDPSRLDVALIHRFLSQEAFWALGRPREVVERSIENSLCFGLYCEAAQVGFCRMVTDHATFGWLDDVFILPEYRGQRLGKWLVACVMSHPEVQGLQRVALATRDAHSLYMDYGGFTTLHNPERWLERKLNVSIR
jgi:GNAT superfamily N-acetyltransferase